jgi:hypothetical protein
MSYLREANTVSVHNRFWNFKRDMLKSKSVSSFKLSNFPKLWLRVGGLFSLERVWVGSCHFA